MVAERLAFGASTGGAPVLAALKQLPVLLRSDRVGATDIDAGVLSPAWHRLVFARSGVDVRAYAVAVTEAVHRAMRRRDVFIVGAVRWGDPRTRLLDDEAWNTVKPEVLTGLKLSAEPAGHLEALSVQLDTAYREVAAQLPDNTAVRIDDAGKVHVSPHDPLGEPPSLKALRGPTSRKLLQAAK